jgi:hypothetical protein
VLQQQHIARESVDLIYLDPLFNSKRDYNLLFKSPKGPDERGQIVTPAAGSRCFVDIPSA